MANVTFATGITRNYVTKALSWLRSLGEHAPGSIVFTVGFSGTWRNLRTVHIDPEDVRGNDPEFICLSHGEFTRWLPDDVTGTIVYCDADMVMQRPPTDDELAMLGALPEGTLMVGPNNGYGDTLWNEAERLGPRVPMRPEWRAAPIYNTGVLAAKRDTFAALSEAHIRQWPEVGTWFGHRARHQWCVCYVMAQGFEVRWMPYSIHLHGHYPLPPGVTRDNGTVCYDSEPVLIRHRL